MSTHTINTQAPRTVGLTGTRTVGLTDTPLRAARAPILRPSAPQVVSENTRRIVGKSLPREVTLKISSARLRDQWQAARDRVLRVVSGATYYRREFESSALNFGRWEARRNRQSRQECADIAKAMRIRMLPTMHPERRDAAALTIKATIRLENQLRQEKSDAKWWAKRHRRNQEVESASSTSSPHHERPFGSSSHPKRRRRAGPPSPSRKRASPGPAPRTPAPPSPPTTLRRSQRPKRKLREPRPFYRHTLHLEEVFGEDLPPHIPAVFLCGSRRPVLDLHHRWATSIAQHNWRCSRTVVRRVKTTCLFRAIKAIYARRGLTPTELKPTLSEVTELASFVDFATISGEEIFFGLRNGIPHVALSYWVGSRRWTLADLVRANCEFSAFSGDGFETITEAALMGSYITAPAPEVYSDAVSVAMPSLPGLNNAVVAPTQLLCNSVSTAIVDRGTIDMFPREMLRKPIRFESTGYFGWQEQHPVLLLKDAVSQFSFNPSVDSGVLPYRNQQVGSLLSAHTIAAMWRTREATLTRPSLQRDARAFLPHITAESGEILNRIFGGGGTETDWRDAARYMGRSRNIDPTTSRALRRGPTLSYNAKINEMMANTFMYAAAPGGRYIRVFSELWRLWFLAAIAEAHDQQGNDRDLKDVNTGSRWTSVGRRAFTPAVHAIAAQPVPVVLDNTGLPQIPAGNVLPDTDLNQEDILERFLPDLKEGRAVFIDVEGLPLSLPGSVKTIEILCHAFGPSTTNMPTLTKRMDAAGLVEGEGSPRAIHSTFYPTIGSYSCRGATNIILHFGSQPITGTYGRQPQFDPNNGSFRMDWLAGQQVDTFTYTTNDVKKAIEYLISTTGHTRDAQDALDMIAHKVYASPTVLTSVANVDLDLIDPNIDPPEDAPVDEGNMTWQAQCEKDDWPMSNGFVEGDKWFQFRDMTLPAYFTCFYVSCNVPPAISSILSRPTSEALWMSYYFCTMLTNSFTWASYATSMRMKVWANPMPGATTTPREEDLKDAMLRRDHPDTLDPFSLYHKNACAHMYKYSPSSYTFLTVDPSRPWSTSLLHESAQRNIGMGHFFKDEAHGGLTTPYLEAWLLKCLPDFLVLPMPGLVPKWPANAKETSKTDQETPDFVRMGATLPPFAGKWWQQDGGQLYSLNFYYSHDGNNDAHVNYVDVSNAAASSPAGPGRAFAAYHGVQRWVVPEQDQEPEDTLTFLPNGTLHVPQPGLPPPAAAMYNEYHTRMHQFSWTQPNTITAVRMQDVSDRNHTFFQAYRAPGLGRALDHDHIEANGTKKARSFAYGLRMHRGWGEPGENAHYERGFEDRPDGTRYYYRYTRYNLNTGNAWKDMRSGIPNKTLTVSYSGPFPKGRMTMPGYHDLITVVTRTAQDQGMVGYSVVHATHDETEQVYDVSSVSSRAFPGTISFPAAFANHSDIHMPERSQYAPHQRISRARRGVAKSGPRSEQQATPSAPTARAGLGQMDYLARQLRESANALGVGHQTTRAVAPSAVSSRPFASIPANPPLRTANDTGPGPQFAPPPPPPTRSPPPRPAPRARPVEDAATKAPRPIDLPLELGHSQADWVTDNYYGHFCGDDKCLKNGHVYRNHIHGEGVEEISKEYFGREQRLGQSKEDVIQALSANYDVLVSKRGGNANSSAELPPTNRVTWAQDSRGAISVNGRGTTMSTTVPLDPAPVLNRVVEPPRPYVAPTTVTDTRFGPKWASAQPSDVTPNDAEAIRSQNAFTRALSGPRAPVAESPHVRTPGADARPRPPTVEDVPDESLAPPTRLDFSFDSPDDNTALADYRRDEDDFMQGGF